MGCIVDNLKKKKNPEVCWASNLCALQSLPDVQKPGFDNKVFLVP